jgi:hypothetical protein
MIKKSKLNSRLAVIAVSAGIVYSLSFSVSGSGERGKVKIKEEPLTKTNTLNDKRLRDPFSEGNELFLPDAQGLNTSLSVAGILVMEAGDKMAVLNVPGFKKTFFVRENDVIQISPEPVDKSKAHGASISLKILKIHESEVIAAPLGDLNNTLIIR